MRGVVFHTDRGSEEYTADAFDVAFRRLGVTQSMGRVGCALDNAAAEAVNSTIKVERLHRRRYDTREQARADVGAWITSFYNARRRHPACGGRSPNDYEHLLETAPPVDDIEEAA